MKKSLTVLLLCMFALKVTGQSISFYLHVMDNERIISFNNGIPVFDDPKINNVFSSYNVTYFAKAFPLSRYEYLQNIYKITADSIGLAQELVNLDNILFPAYERIGEVVPLGAYYPNDWNDYWPNDTGALGFVNAPEAWDINKGDTNIIIGLSDSYFDLDHEDMQGQYAEVGSNHLPSTDVNHGSLVASLVAAKTDNGIGISAIGFNCRLFATTQKGDAESLRMAERDSINIRVINASWLNTIYYDFFFNSTAPFTSRYKK